MILLPLRCSTARSINQIEVVSQDSVDFDVAVDVGFDVGFDVDVYVDAIILQLISIIIIEQISDNEGILGSLCTSS